MQLIVLHYHFRPGGVRRVIELAAPPLVAQWPASLRGVMLAAGEAPPAHWLRAFRKRLGGVPVRVFVEPAFGYVSETKLQGATLTRRVRDGLERLLRLTPPGDRFLWAHNLALGRNLTLARELTAACRESGTPLVLHHHDWWFENRWPHFASLTERAFRRLPSVARATLANSPNILHAAINRADAAVLKKHFPGRAAWLPNPVEAPADPPRARVRAARDWLRRQLGEDAPVWLLPCRLLRRKNIAEALLLARWLRPEAWLVTTAGVSSDGERPCANSLGVAARRHRWRLRLGVLAGDDPAQPSVPELMAASEVVLLTSIQEGFGLPYLEAAAARRPLLARALPNIAPDLAEFGFKFPQSYNELLVAPDLFDWRKERARQARRFAAWKKLMPRPVAALAGTPALLAAGATPRPAPFSRLTLAAQLEVLAKPAALSWERCVPLNRWLPVWRARAASGQLEVSPWPRAAEKWLGGHAYARRFLEFALERKAKPHRPGASEKAQRQFLRTKLRAEFTYPLLWTETP